MDEPSEDQLREAIESATRRAVSSLFREHPGHYYYCSLVTTGEAHAPILSAWSEEALGTAVAEASDPNEALDMLKWSYADSPFLQYGDEYFASVRALFGARPVMGVGTAGEDWATEYEIRLRAMERAVSNLDSEGLFGSGAQRSRIVVNVEVMPPDYTNTERAIRLNPPEALTVWLEEIAEPLPG